MAWPMSPVVAPGFPAAMPRSMASYVTSTNRRAFSLTSPTRYMRLVSPCQPSTMTVTSMLTMSVAQGLVAGDAVTDHVVDRGAQRVPVAAVAETGRHAAMIDHVFIGELVEAGGIPPRLPLRHHQVENFGGEPARLAHALESPGLVQRHGEAGAAHGLETLGIGTLRLHRGPCRGAFCRVKLNQVLHIGFSERHRQP